MYFSTFFSSYYSFDFFGKMIFIFLIFLSLISWITMAYKIKLIREAKKNSFLFEKDIKKNKLFSLNIENQKYKNIKNPFYEIFLGVKKRTYQVLNKNSFFFDLEKSVKKEKVFLFSSDISIIEAEADSSISSNLKFLEKNIFVLSTVITLAPFLGLLGTVWGILVTFSNLQADSSLNSFVLSGLSMALTTTVVGLVVAIPSLIGYNFLKNSIKEFSSDMQNFATFLITSVEIQYRKVEDKK